MADPIRSSRAGTVNAILTGYFNDISKGSTKFVGLQAAGFIEVDGLGGTYSRQADTSEINLKENPGELDGLNDDAPAKQVGITDTTETVSLERDSFASIAPLTRILAAARNGQDYDIRAMRRVSDKIHGRHEYMVMNLLSTEANFATAVDPGDYNTPTVDFVTPVKLAMDTVDGDINQIPNTMVMNPNVASALEKNNQVMGWNGQFYNNAATPAARNKLIAYVAETFEGMKLIIARVKYTDATGTKKYVMGDHIAIYHQDNTGLPSLINTFGNYWLGESEGPMTLAAVRDYESNDPQGTVYVADALYKVQSDNDEAGYLLKNVLS